MGDAVIRPATAADAPAVLALLEGSALPTDGVEPHLADFLVAERDGEVRGVAGVERYADGWLLRSVAVADTERGQGLGARLTTRALEAAALAGAPSVYLLTTTAEGYFPRHGFRRIGRDSVPASVRASVEFTGACPSTATVMVLDLEREKTTNG